MKHEIKIVAIACKNESIVIIVLNYYWILINWNTKNYCVILFSYYIRIIFAFPLNIVIPEKKPKSSTTKQNHDNIM